MATLLTTDCLLGMFTLQDCSPLLALWFLILQLLSPTMGKMSKDRNNILKCFLSDGFLKYYKKK